MAQPLTRSATPLTASFDELSRRIARYLPPTGRFLFSVLFITTGVLKFVHWDGTAAIMEEKGIPLVGITLPAVALLEILGGLTLLLGWYARCGALTLAAFLIPATFIFHNFWAYDGEAYMSQVQHFLKNLALMGGLLYIAGFGPGACSVDNTMAANDRRRGA